MNPVALPSCRDMLATNPVPTGSATLVNTTGMVRVAANNPVKGPAPETRITSGASATSSCAYLRVAVALPRPERYSILTLRPSAQPNCCNACTNASTSGRPVAAPPKSTPTRRMRSPCCARAASGHVAAALPRSVMNSRRFTAQVPPVLRTERIAHLSTAGDRCTAGLQCGLRQVHPRSCYVANVPGTGICTAAIASLFDHLVGAGEQRGRHVEAERLLQYRSRLTRFPNRRGLWNF